MKKFLALLLAVMMIASMSITAFAADATTPTQTSETDQGLFTSQTDSNVTNQGTGTTSNQYVYVSSTPSSTSNPVYYVVVEWKALNFHYAFASDSTWDPVNHKYVAGNTGTTGTWYVGTTATGTANATIDDAITVANHSDAQVWVKTAFTDAGALTAVTKGVTATILDNGKTSIDENATAEHKVLADAKGTIYADAPSVKYEVSVEGTPTDTDSFYVGTITVTVANKDPNTPTT